MENKTLRLYYLEPKKSSRNIAKKTKTGNIKNDIRAYIGRYVGFWCYRAPDDLLLNNNPVLSNALMLRFSLYLLDDIAFIKM